jgi:transposase
MIPVPSDVRVWLAVGRTDMRRGMNGLALQVQDALGRELRLLPPYSPDLNPIEMAFAKLKAILRKAAERTLDGLWDAIASALPQFAPDECANYFTAAGYARV